MHYKKRTYGLGIWALGLGYYLFYTPYSGLTKALSNGLLPGIRQRVPGAVLLPASVIATVLCMLGFITVMRWWQYAGRRTFLGRSFPFPRRLTFLSGVCTAVIIGTTTLAFSFKGISIVLVLVLLRGGVLILAPIVDSMFRRRVRWFSWAAMLISLLAVTIALSDAANYQLSLPAIVDVAAYVTAYFFKFQFMTRLAKIEDKTATLRYFVEEQMIASPLLLLALGVAATIGAGDLMKGFRFGFTTFLFSRGAPIALLIGFFYAGLCICTTFIFLDRRENTFCVPMHCGSSMLSGFTATYALTLFLHQPSPSTPQLASAVFIVIALAVLSPLHHFSLYVTKLQNSVSRISDAWTRLLAGRGKPTVVALQKEVLFVAEKDPTESPQLILFVCTGNTCRSPMAAAIGNAEIARRLQIPFETVRHANVRAVSAGVAAEAGAPMTDEAKQALRLLGIPPNGHRASNVTAELADEVQRIFCMTRAHRDALVSRAPAAAGKTLCLDPELDIDDPIGKGMTAYVDCAQRIQTLVRLRFDEMALDG